MKFLILCKLNRLYEALNDDGGGTHEARKILKNAKKLEDHHNTLVETFFRVLRDDTGMMKRIRMMDISAGISDAKLDLRRIYKNLRSKYHRIPLVLRQYATYLRGFFDFLVFCLKFDKIFELFMHFF